MFKEKYLVFRNPDRPERKEKAKSKPDRFDAQRQQSAENFAEALIQQNLEAQDKVAKVFMVMGMDLEKGKELVMDGTNPFIYYLTDFVVNMEAGGYSVRPGNSQNGNPEFLRKGFPAKVPDFVLYALIWANKLYPGLQDCLKKDYDQNLVGVAVRYELFGVKNLLKSLSQSKNPSAEYIRWARWELLQLKRGVDPETLVKIEKEKFGGGKEEEIKKDEQPKILNKADSKSEDQVKMKAAREEHEKRMAGKSDLIEAKYGDGKNLTQSQLHSASNEIVDYIRDLKGVSPAVDQFLSGEDGNFVEQYMKMVATGKMDTDIRGKLKKNREHFEEVVKKAKESGDYEELAALEDLEGAVGYFGEIATNFYLKDIIDEE